MARILDTAPDFATYARKSMLENPTVREIQWKQRYEGAHPEVFAAFYAKHGSREGQQVLVRELTRIRERASAAAPVMREIIEELEPRVREVLDLPPEPAPLHVLMVGPFAVSALVGRLGDDVALFHCLEWFETERGAWVLVGHETTHAWHELALGDPPPEEDPAWTAFSEGIAIHVSRLVVPDRPDSDYFWYGNESFEDWLPWCRERGDELLARFADGLDDPKTVDQFFGAGLIDGNWRVGFYVADEIVARLGRPLAELVRLRPPEAVEAVRAVLAG